MRLGIVARRSSAAAWGPGGGGSCQGSRPLLARAERAAATPTAAVTRACRESFGAFRSSSIPPRHARRYTIASVPSLGAGSARRRTAWRASVSATSTSLPSSSHSKAQASSNDPAAARSATSLPKMRKLIADRLRNPELIAKARVFPYQLMTAYQALSVEMPAEIRDALHDAMELSVQNVPKLRGQIVVCPDVSGSMSGAVTGYRKGATTATRFVDVAGLVAAAVLRRNPSATVLPFEVKVRDVRLEPRDTILTNAARLSEQWGGGTNCAAPLEWLRVKGRAPDLVVMVSDNQSWAHAAYGNNGTAMMQAWEKLKRRNPKAKLVCIDIAPYGTTQAKEREDVLNIGGFSDTVFDQIAAFANGEMGSDHWVGQIKAVEV